MEEGLLAGKIVGRRGGREEEEIAQTRTWTWRASSGGRTYQPCTKSAIDIPLALAPRIIVTRNFVRYAGDTHMMRGLSFFSAALV